jgi:peroxiredoxin
MGGILLLGGRLLLAAAFGVASFAKLASLSRAREGVIEFGVPPALATPLTGALVAGELAVAVALVSVPTAWYGAIGAIVLLSIFCVAIATNLLLDRRPNCNCFGQIAAAPIGWPTLARSVALATVAVLLVAYGHDAQAYVVSWPPSIGVLEWLSIGVALVFFGLLVVIAALLAQVLRQQGRMLLRFEAIEERLGIGAPRSTPIPSRAGLAPGTPAPTFTLPDLDGASTSLDGVLAAKKPVLFVFSNPACGPCQALLPEIAEWRRDLHEGLTIALISEASADANREYAPILGSDRVFVQRGREVADAYEAHATPAAVVVTADGRIASFVAQGAEAIRRLVLAIRDGELPALASPPPIALGATAPDFVLETLAGGRISLADLRGEPTLFLFWDQHCGFCQRMLPDLKAWEANGSVDAARLVVVSNGSVEDHRGWDLAAPVALDAGSRLARAFGANGTPMAILLDDEGRVDSGLAAGAHAFFALAHRERSSGLTAARIAATAG